MTRVFVLNAGSSSVKYALVDPETGERSASGTVERIGAGGPPDHAAALAIALDGAGRGIDAVGHRIVHGGELYRDATLVDDAVEAGVEALGVLAPLHNPPGLAGIRAARAALPEVPHVVVFDTAFHTTIGPAAATYAIDRGLARAHGVRRYGFHGTSYRYVSGAAAQLLGHPLEELKLIVLHLGNGASAAAIAGGRSIDTSMGLTPLEGLVMGTRSGDVDPAALLHLARVAGLGVDELDDLLNRRSGLLGLAGASDLRSVEAAAAAGDADAALALEVYVHRIVKYVGAYWAELGGLDALVFTAGVGENSALVRARVIGRLAALGLELDPERNAANGPVITTDMSRVPALVVPTDEELEIARQAAAFASRRPSR